LEEIMKISSRGTPVQGDPYKKYLSNGQEALVHRSGPVATNEPAVEI
jgi:hypothetical protein